MKKDKEKKDLLVFGYGLTLILSFFATRIYFKHGMTGLPVFLALLALGILSLTLFKQDWLKVVLKYWMKAVHPIGEFISHVVMIIIFYGIFAPVGILLRIMKKDFLDRSLDPEAKSYWRLREQKPFDKDRCTKQF